MAFTPTGTFYLIAGVPLDNTYNDTIDFADIAEQNAYFIDKVIKTYNDYTYIRKDSSIKVKDNIEGLYGANYCMYRNSTTGRWIYAFIVDKRYINEQNTELILQTDVIQTYMFDVAWGDTFIEREHQNRWTGINNPVFNVVDEGLTLGDEYSEIYTDIVATSEKYYLVITSQQLHSAPAVPVMIQKYPTPFYFYIVPTYAGESYMDAQWLCQLLASNPAVLSVSWIPYAPFTLANEIAKGSVTEVTYEYNEGQSVLNMYWISGDIQASRNLGTVNKFAGVTLPSSFGPGIARHPKYESKLLCYPYTYNVLTDYMAKPLILKNEYLDTQLGNDISIALVQSLAFAMKSRVYVSSGYLNDLYGRFHALVNDTINDLPLKTNEYYNYMLSSRAQAITGIALSAVEGVAGVGTALLTGGTLSAAGIGATVHSVSTISSILAKQKDLQNIPDTVRHMGNNLSFDMADDNIYLRFLTYQISPQIKKIIADYFAMYGYKCLEVKKPNLRTRYYYNYIKTVGCNIDGDFDNKDIAQIKAVYDKGITIWHNRAGVTPLKYDFDNVEMSLI